MYYNSTDNGNVCSFHPPPGTRISKVTIERRKKNPSGLPEGSARFLGRKPRCLRLYPILFRILVPVRIKGVIQDVAVLC